MCARSALLLAIGLTGVPGAVCAQNTVSSAPAHAADRPAALTVVFTGVEIHRGAIMLGVYGDEAAYRASKAVQSRSLTASAAQASVVIDGLAPGVYAIKAFHDVNGDGVLNANLLGIPTEPFAFSNNDRHGRGPLAWRDAAFRVGPGATTVRIAIR